MLPEPAFVPSTPISSAAVNSDLSDVADALTDSLSRTGDGGMLAALPLHIDGFVYQGDADTGMSRPAANTQVMKCGGVDVVEVTPAGMSMLGSRIFPLPIGLGPLPWSGLTAPAGWVLVFGQITLSRTTYAALWAFAQAEIAAGNTFYNNGNGSTTFGIGDMRGRIPAGKDNMGGVAAGRLTIVDATVLGNAGGAQSVTLTTAQIPSHTHANTLNDPGHGHVFAGQFLSVFDSTGGGAAYTNSGSSPVNDNDTGITINNAPAGGGLDHANVQPILVTNYIIYAGV